MFNTWENVKVANLSLVAAIPLLLHIFINLKDGLKRTVEEKPKKTINKVKLSLGQIKDKWQEVLVCLKKYNQSLASTLKISQPSVIQDDGTLEICFKHKFHQQRINDLKNKQLLERVLQEIFGVKLLVKTVVVKELAGNNIEIEALTESKTDQGLNSILKTFGGQVVE